MILIVAVLAGTVPIIPAIIILTLCQHQPTPKKAARRVVWGLTGYNVVLALFAAGLMFAWLASPSTALAAPTDAQTPVTDPYASLAAAITVGLASIGAGVAVGNTGSAAVGTIAEKPESFGRALIFVGLAEGIAIYGLIVAFMILSR
jgi:V/A-type H+-transporting ATPase subunit K